MHSAENNTALLNIGMQTCGEIRKKRGRHSHSDTELLLAHESCFFWVMQLKCCPVDEVAFNIPVQPLFNPTSALHPSAIPLPLVISSHADADAAPAVRVQGKSCFQWICRLTRGHSHPPTRTSCIGVHTENSPPRSDNRKTSLSKTQLFCSVTLCNRLTSM